MVIYDEITKGVQAKVEATEDWVFTTCRNALGTDTVTLTRDEAIAAARAILAHYKEPV